jgi:hypothetical protein
MEELYREMVRIGYSSGQPNRARLLIFMKESWRASRRLV